VERERLGKREKKIKKKKINREREEKKIQNNWEIFIL
jgi:hypothetical protein